MENSFHHVYISLHVRTVGEDLSILKYWWTQNSEDSHAILHRLVERAVHCSPVDYSNIIRYFHRFFTYLSILKYWWTQNSHAIANCSLFSSRYYSNIIRNFHILYLCNLNYFREGFWLEEQHKKIIRDLGTRDLVAIDFISHLIRFRFAMNSSLLTYVFYSLEISFYLHSISTLGSHPSHDAKMKRHSWKNKIFWRRWRTARKGETANTTQILYYTRRKTLSSCWWLVYATNIEFDGMKEVEGKFKTLSVRLELLLAINNMEKWNFAIKKRWQYQYNNIMFYFFYCTFPRWECENKRELGHMSWAYEPFVSKASRRLKNSSACWWWRRYVNRTRSSSKRTNEVEKGQRKWKYARRMWKS